MKILVDTKETGQKEGLESLMGKRVVFLCMNYFYVGELTGVNDTQVKIEKPEIIYETGEWSAKAWKDAQPLGAPFAYLMLDKIELYFPVSK
jgi:hypothetical protein